MLLRFTAISLLIVLLINTTWYYPIVKWEEWQIRREVKNGIKKTIPEKELHVIAASLDDQRLQWEEANHEFRLEGKMYDIVKTISHNDSLYYYCISDEDETLLFATLDDKVQQQLDKEHQQPSGNPAKKIIKSIVGAVFILPEQLHHCYLAPYSFYPDHFINRYTSYKQDILTPPPQFLS